MRNIVAELRAVAPLGTHSIGGLLNEAANAIEAAARLDATLVLGIPDPDSDQVAFVDPFAWWDDVRQKRRALRAAIASPVQHSVKEGERA